MDLITKFSYVCYFSIITKTYLFKYTGNFTTKKENFQKKNLILYIILLKT